MAASDRSQRAPHGSSPAVWENVPPRNPNFIGREALLADLAARLTDSRSPTAVLPEAMYGLGGIGKSQLAIEYVYRHQADYDLVCWIPSERTPGIVNTLSHLAGRLGVGESGDAAATVSQALDALRRGIPYTRWLLVFDNAENAQTLAPFLPNARHGAVLITSRNPQWEDIAGCVEVDVFSRAESVALLNKRGPALTPEDADLLAEALGDLPLAIEQAAAWRAQTGMTAREYLRLFDEKRSDLLFEGAPNLYQESVATAWNVSLDRIEETNPEALHLLQVCAYLAPEPIPRSLFSGAHRGAITRELDVALADPMRLGRAVREIKRFSLARIDPRNNSLQMHRLVQLVLLQRMTPHEQERMRLGAQSLLASADPRDPESNAQWYRYSELYPHVVASDAIHSADPWVRDLVHNTARYLQRFGDHDSALDFTREAHHAATELFGAEDEKTLQLAFWLGWILFSMGRYQEAADINRATLDVHERALPPGPTRAAQTNESHLDAIGAVAADLRVKGDFTQALELSRRVFETATEAFGEDDACTLNAAHNLGVALRLVGRFQEAYELDRTTWELKQTLLGAEHEQTLLTRVGLTIDERELGLYRHARNRQEEVVSQYLRHLREDNAAVLHARRVLAVARRKAGDHEAALELSEQVLGVMEERFGPTHPDTIAATLGLSVDLRYTGRLERARELAEASLAHYRRIFGDHHPHTVSAQANLAITSRLDDLCETAHTLDRAAYTTLLAALGERHPLTLVVATNLASDLAALGRHEEALALGARTHALSAGLLGEAHPSTLSLAANQALDLTALGRHDEAAALHDQVVHEMRDRLGPDHPATTALTDRDRANCFIDPLPL
ncbi:tetratricopeptide repeat protein [Streptomyces roseirectus]|uniref:Tetratricopeptide repeat protein n=1 Tax=Streptomyces roseirectus TaxID=2768066 RepID=A0A7H0IQY4_9ACTN|nr:FxSxx-COOH system tetratricopeptide repeat protein [Streptomyces roseirectus]QNP75200.1 tetratricopeptide repeat protein [Streptomyces roseirectus]